MKTVARHRACQGCGYDLFTLPADGMCPECGRGIGGLRKRREPKNPRRVAGQLRRMVAQSKRHRYIVAAFWILPLCGLLVCWWFSAQWWIWGFVTLALLSGIIQQLTTISKRRDWEDQLGKIDGGSDVG